MKEMIKPWLEQNAHLKGLLGCGVRCPDDTLFIKGVGIFPKENLENALRCVADTYQVVKLNQFPETYLRWIYQKALLYCVKRDDGTFLAAFTSRDPHAVDLEGLGRMLAEFQHLGASAPE